jgi:hypothetical protein
LGRTHAEVAAQVCAPSSSLPPQVVESTAISCRPVCSCREIEGRHEPAQACHALANATSGTPANKKQLMGREGKRHIELVLAAMRSHEHDGAVQEHACALLANLADSVVPEALIVAAGAVEAAVTVMRVHMTDAGVQDAACLLLLNLACRGGAKAEGHSEMRHPWYGQLREAGVVGAAREVMLRHQRGAPVLHQRAVALLRKLEHIQQWAATAAVRGRDSDQEAVASSGGGAPPALAPGSLQASRAAVTMLVTPQAGPPLSPRSAVKAAKAAEKAQQKAAARAKKEASKEEKAAARAEKAAEKAAKRLAKEEGILYQ